MIDWTTTTSFLVDDWYYVRVIEVEPRTVFEGALVRGLWVVLLEVLEGRNPEVPWSSRGARLRVIFHDDDAELMRSFCWAAGARGAFDEETRTLRSDLLRGQSLAVDVVAKRARGLRYKVWINGVCTVEMAALAR